MTSQLGASLLQNVYLFKELNQDELEKVASVSRVQAYNPGDEIFAEGTRAEAIYIIKYGSVKIQHSGREELVDVATLGTGSHFGEMAFVDGEARSASVIAMEKTEIVSIEFADLKKVLDDNMAIAVKVYKAFAHFLCGRLRITTNDLTFAREKNLRHF